MESSKCGDPNGRGRRHLLVLAPSGDLYGSTRALLHALPALVETFHVTLAFGEAGPAVQRAAARGAVTKVWPDFALRRRNLSVRGFPMWSAHCASALREAQRVHEERPIDLVYSNTLASGIGPLLRLRWRVPHVVHMHECPQQPRWLPRALLRIARFSSDLVICNSESTRAFLLRFEPALEKSSVVVHNGIELPAPDARPRPISREPLRITCVARIHPKKGHVVLLEAARRAPGALDGGWEIHFYGDTLPEHEGLRADLTARIQEYGLEGTVHWHGFVADTREMYQDADVAVVPSVQAEEFSLVCVEAQSMELPVVATGPGGPSEILVDGETGYIVPPGDPLALAEAIGRLEADPELRRDMGRRGRARMLAHFSREVYGDRVRALCEGAVSARPAGSRPKFRTG